MHRLFCKAAAFLILAFAVDHFWKLFLDTCFVEIPALAAISGECLHDKVLQSTMEVFAPIWRRI